MTNIPASFLPGATNFSTAAATETIDADRSLYLKLFSGEMFKGFQHNTIARDLIMRRTLTNGRSMQFIFTGRLGAEFHTRGTPILGNTDGAPPVAEKTITVDDLLVASAFVYELDEVLAHYDLRSEIARKIGYALAEKYDRLAFRAIARGARKASPLSSTSNTTYVEPGGTQIQVGNGTNASDAYNANHLITAFFDAAAALDEKGVSTEGRVAVLNPRQYYTLLQEKNDSGFVTGVSPLINRDQNGNALQSGQGVMEIAGIKVYKSMNIPFFSNYGTKYDPASPVAGTDPGVADPGNTGSFVGAGIEDAEDSDTGIRNDYGATTDFANSCGLIFQREAAGMVEAIGPQVQTTSGDVSVIYQGDVMLGRLACGADYLNPAASVELFAGTTTAPAAF